MAETFRLPDLGEGLKEAEIVTWHVAVGDHVVADQPLVSVETDKAIVEVPAPSSGHIAALHGAVGDIVEVGAPLVEIATNRAADTGAIVGDIGAVQKPPARARPARRATGAAHAKATPAVRKLAASLGVDLSSIEATGPDGTISRADVEEAARGAACVGEKLRGVRRAMFLSMTLAGSTVVPATVTDEADIDAWTDLEDLTVRLIRAVVAGCKAAPALNAWLDAETQTRQLHDRVDLGIAVEAGDGLFVPVLRDAGNADGAALRLELDSIKASVESRAAPRDRFVGATITLSNYGLVGGRFAALVVVPPQVAILGAGRAAGRVVAESGQAVIRRHVPLSLTFDHRAVTGIEATRFLNAVIEDLAQRD
jgi:2-oxoisovalerate dehydrogenase E2 component (dihydrolipoyl transacylase)